MAFAILPKPGEKYGPCANPCQHRDCAATREMVARICPRCKKPIGYDTPFADFEGKTWHNLCLELMAEESR